MKKTILSILTAAAMIVGLLAGPGGTAVSASEAAGGGSTAAGTLEGVSFVLIYNPDIFDENDAARQLDRRLRCRLSVLTIHEGTRRR